jgi:putative OPT family oligopeptide transporter
VTSASEKSAEGPRELTAVAIALGLAFSVVMGAANVYLGLRVGMTVSASIPAAVLAMGAFRLLPRRGRVLESNMVQTAASAGESLAAGIIFTVPAFVLAGVWDSYHGWERFFVVSTIALAGGILGILFMIPMRKVFVVEQKDLPYPEGVACAEVLRAADAGRAEALWLLCGVGIGGVVKILEGLLGLLRAKLVWNFPATRELPALSADVSPALLSVGYIVGLPVASLVFLGGAIAWFATMGLPAPAEGAIPPVKYVGVGAMVLGGVASLFKVRGSLVAALRELKASRRGATEELPATPREERNLSGRTVLITGVVAVFLVAMLYYHVTASVGISIVALVAMTVLSFFFSAVASYIVGLVGNSNSPVSGMTITAVLVAALLIGLCGYTGPEAILATLGVAGVVCCVACTSGDVCNDLKTGQLVGATPRSQQILQILGVVVAAGIMWPTLFYLHEGDLKAGGTGIGGESYPAPQAHIFASLARGFFGDGELPEGLLLLGVGVGVGILLLDSLLARLQGPRRSVQLHVMPVAVGMYLPFSLAVPIFLGGLVAWFSARAAGRRSPARGGVLLASGLIAGESLVGVVLGVLAYYEVGGPGWLPPGGFLTFATVSTLVLILVLLQMAGRRRSP